MPTPSMEALPTPLADALSQHAATALARFSSEDPARFACLADRQEQLSEAFALLWSAAQDGDIDTASTALTRVERLLGEMRSGSMMLRRLAMVAAGGGR